MATETWRHCINEWLTARPAETAPIEADRQQFAHQLLDELADEQQCAQVLADRKARGTPLDRLWAAELLAWWSKVRSEPSMWPSVPNASC